jgi:hypothetical protein
MSESYFFDKDRNGTFYIIPTRKREEWNKWLNLPEDNPYSWDALHFTEIIEGKMPKIEFYLEKDLLGISQLTKSFSVGSLDES